MTEFKSWRDIAEWADAHGYKKMAERMRINNKCWLSSGEFGRSQVAICDAIRLAESEDEREERAREIESACAEDWFADINAEDIDASDAYALI